MLAQRPLGVRLAQGAFRVLRLGAGLAGLWMLGTRLLEMARALGTHAWSTAFAAALGAVMSVCLVFAAFVRTPRETREAARTAAPDADR